MVLLVWVLVGWLSGWLAGRSLEGNGYGPSMDVVMGIGGAVLGGLLMRSTGVSGYAAAILTTLAAVVCAVLFTTVAALVNGRSFYTRQLSQMPVRPRFRN
jgi:uncharacterized membrane protein YeaQ/YmgE (transglycosylase-associated protein family)